MKTLFFSFLLAWTTAPVLAADTESLNGKWDVQTSVSGHDSAQACTFTLKKDMLTGQCVGEAATVDIGGTIQGARDHNDLP